MINILSKSILVNWLYKVIFVSYTFNKSKLVHVMIDPEPFDKVIKPIRD